MNKKLMTVLLSCLTFQTFAANPTFNYFDIGYVVWRPDSTSLSSSLKGLELKASKTINDYLYVAGDLNYVSKNSNSLTLVTAGIGYMNHFSDNASFFAELDIANVSADNFNNETGYEATVGVRAMVTEALELKGAIEYLDINGGSGGGGDSSFNLGTAYMFNERFGAYFDYKINQDVNRFSLGLRLSF